MALNAVIIRAERVYTIPNLYKKGIILKNKRKREAERTKREEEEKRLNLNANDSQLEGFISRDG